MVGPVGLAGHCRRRGACRPAMNRSWCRGPEIQDLDERGQGALIEAERGFEAVILPPRVFQSNVRRPGRHRHGQETLNEGLPLSIVLKVTFGRGRVWSASTQPTEPYHRDCTGNQNQDEFQIVHQSHSKNGSVPIFTIMPCAQGICPERVHGSVTGSAATGTKIALRVHAFGERRNLSKILRKTYPQAGQ